MSALTDTLDKIKGFDVGGVDYITKPFRQEEVLARVKAHLTIVHQQKQLQELNAAKDKFFSIIAHDLRGPLSTLRTINQHAAERLKNDDPEKLKEIIELQQTSTDRLFTLLDNLLTWSRIQRGMMEYCPQAIENRNDYHSKSRPLRAECRAQTDSPQQFDPGEDDSVCRSPNA